jgi:protein SCO1
MKKTMAWLWPITMIQIMVAGLTCEASGFDRDLALNLSQNAIDRQLDNFQLRNTANANVSISDYLGKPLIISLIYTNCRDICSTTTQHLADVVSKAREVLGADSFNVFTIGFDVNRDTPIMMSRFRDKLQVDDEHWQFLSADAATMEQLSAQLGFLYEPSVEGFDHQVQASLITASGIVRQQVYGAKFNIPTLVEPLKRLVFNVDSNTGILTTISHRYRLFLTVYDASNSRYRFRYSYFIKFFIGATIMLLIGIVLTCVWHERLTK